MKKKHPKPSRDIPVLCVFSPELYGAILEYVERRRQAEPGVEFSVRSAIRSLVGKGLLAGDVKP
jgi:hypothetical protein